MSDAARARLAERFEAARSADRTLDKLADDSSEAPQSQVTQMDRARQLRQAEPMLLGVISQDAAWPIENDCDLAAATILPVLDGPAAGLTAAIEGRALFGQAGVELGILLAASGAHRLQRVVGWPTGAVAIDDTLYVNASWLVALAPGEKQSLDGGIDSRAESSKPSTAGGSSKPAASGASLPLGVPPSGLSLDSNPTAVIKGAPGYYYSSDAGVTTLSTEPQQSTEPSGPTAVDVCSACADSCASSGSTDDSGDACDTSSDSGGDSCDSSSGDTTSNSCDSSSDTTSDSCNGNYADSGSMDGGGQCQLGGGSRGKKSQTMAWVIAPLGYLLFRRRP